MAEKGLGNMFRGSIGIWALLWWLFFSPPFLSAGEVYRWTDEKGVVHFTDDLSQIPAQYQRQFEKREVKEEFSEPDKKQTVPGKPSVPLQGKPDRAKEGLDAYERKIESKKAIEKKIAVLEEEMRAAEERIKQLKEDQLTSGPFPDLHFNRKNQKYVPVTGPLPERERLQLRIQNIKKEIGALEEQRSKIIRGL